MGFSGGLLYSLLYMSDLSDFSASAVAGQPIMGEVTTGEAGMMLDVLVTLSLI